MSFDECQVYPLRPLFLFRRCPCTIPPASRAASPFSCQYLIGTRLHWRGLPQPFIITSQFQGHSSWHLYRGRQSNSILLFHLWNFISLSTSFHTQRPIHIQRRLGPPLIHSYTHLENKIAHPFTRTRPSFSALFAPWQTQDSPAAATTACITDSNS